MRRGSLSILKARLLCTGHLKIWRPIELHPHAPLKITSNHRCQENRERVSAGDRQTKSSNKNLKTMFFSISKSDKRKKKKGERSMYTEKKFFRHCSCLWRRATAGLWTWRCCVSDEWACVRVSTTLALQVRFPPLHRKEINFFRRQTTSTVEC